MKLLFIINTPGQAHTWKHVIVRLLSRGHTVKLLARDYGATPALLRTFGFQFDVFKTNGSRYSRLLSSPRHFQECYRLSHVFEPSLVIGFGIDAAITAARSRKPSIVFIDDDQTKFQNLLTRLLGSTIVTPDCFNGNLGRKHIRIRGYKELAYLHPNYFHPDSTVLDEMKVKSGEKYVILRFGVLDAVHDIGATGFPESDRIELVSKLEKHARVFVSTEAPLPESLEPYRLDIPCERFHDAIYFAQMLVGDTGTATTEAALLGTPAIQCSRGVRGMGNFEDLSRYGLLYRYFDSPGQAIEKAIELAQQPRLKDLYAPRRERLLADKIDVGSFMSDFIESYPDGLNRPIADYGVKQTC